MRAVKLILPILMVAMLLGCKQRSPEFAPAPPPPLPAACTQMLLVTTKDWYAVPGVMRRFTRTNAASAWTQVDAAVPVVVGRKGLGWGRGVITPTNFPGPVKKEGDGKSPAGIFRLSSAFGLAEPDEMVNVKMPYQQLTGTIECVDDVKSTNYNAIVDRAKTAQPDWNSSEKMRAIGDPYRLGVVVDHNTDPREPGGGSCVFLHIWSGPRTGTAGCTAMASGQMANLLFWLDPAAQPVLVQLPESEYKRLQKDWGLP